MPMKVRAVGLQSREERLKAAYAWRLSHALRDHYSLF